MGPARPETAAAAAPAVPPEPAVSVRAVPDAPAPPARPAHRVPPELRPPDPRPKRCPACKVTYRTPRAYARHLSWCGQLPLFVERGDGWGPPQAAPAGPSGLGD